MLVVVFAKPAFYGAMATFGLQQYQSEIEEKGYRKKKGVHLFCDQTGAQRVNGSRIFV